MQQRFPTRTVVLMLLTLVAFVWFWAMTHRERKKASTIDGTNTVGTSPSVRLVSGGDQ